MQPLMQREMEKYFKNLHGKEKPLFLSLDKNDDGNIGASTIFIDNQSSSNHGNGSYTGGSFQLGLGKRRWEQDGIIPSSSSLSSPLGDGNQNEEKEMEMEKEKEKQKGKTPRLNWTPELQQKFKDAYEALGETRATPNRIRELMNEPQMTPQHISSYLQKFRARIKNPVEETTTEAEKEKPVDSPVPRDETCLNTYPTLSLNLNRDPYPIGHQLHIPRPSLVSDGVPDYYITSGNLLHNSSLYNFRENTLHNFTNIFGHRVQENVFPGFQPLEPIPGAGAFQNHVDFCEFLSERSPRVLLQDLNRSYGMPGDDIGTREYVPGAIGIGRMQELNAGLGLVRNNIHMPQQLTPEEINNIFMHFPGNDSGRDPSSPSSVTQPLPPYFRIGTGEERDIDETSSEDVAEEDMEKFLNMEEFSAKSDGDDGYVIP